MTNQWQVSSCSQRILRRSQAETPLIPAVQIPRTSSWVDWFNNRRLLEPIGNIPPTEAEERYYAMLDEQKLAA